MDVAQQPDGPVDLSELDEEIVQGAKRVFFRPRLLADRQDLVESRTTDDETLTRLKPKGRRVGGREQLSSIHVDSSNQAREKTYYRYWFGSMPGGT
jgi:hypothetical protein